MSLIFPQNLRAIYGSGGGSSSPLARLTLTETARTLDSIDLSWDNPDSLSSFEVYRNGVLVSTQAGTTYSATSLPLGETSYFSVRGTDGEFFSPSSNVITHVATLQQPVLSLVSKTATTINLSGTNPDSLPDVELYQDGTLISEGSLTTWELTGLTELTSYTFTMRVGSGGNWSPMSAPLIVTTDEAGSGPVEPEIPEKHIFDPDYKSVSDGTILHTIDGWDLYTRDAGDTHNSKDAWVINEGRIFRNSNSDFSGTGRFAILHNTENPNHTLSLTASLADRMWLGATDASNGLYVQFNPGSTVVVLYVEDNVSTNLGSYNGLPSGEYTVKLNLFGDTLYLYIDNKFIRTFDLPESRIKGTKVGFTSFGGTQARYIDNVYIAEIKTIFSEVDAPTFWPTLGQTATGVISGQINGQDTSHVQYRLIDADDSTLIQDWQFATEYNQVGSSFTAKAVIPTCYVGSTSAYIIDVRPITDLDGFSATSQVTAGYMVAAYGQSNSIFRNSFGGFNVTPAVSYDIDTFIAGAPNISGDQWSRLTSNTTTTNSLAEMSNTLSSLLGVYVGVAIDGIGSRSLADLLLPENIDPMKAKFIELGGENNIIAWLWTQGEAEASGVNGVDSALYTQRFNEDLRSEFNSVAEAPIFVSIIGKHDVADPSPHWGIMRKNLYNLQNLDDTYIAHSFVDIPMSDLYHYTGNGYLEANRRAALSIAQQLGAQTYNGRGPIVTSGNRSGSTITLNVDLNGATSLTGSNLNYWDVSADDFATTLDITSVNVVANQVVIELANTPSGAVKIRSFWSSNYGHGAQPTPVFAIGNYADGTTIALEPLFEPLTIN